MTKFKFWLSYFLITTGVKIVPDPRTKEILSESITRAADQIIEELSNE